MENMISMVYNVQKQKMTANPSSFWLKKKTLLSILDCIPKNLLFLSKHSIMYRDKSSYLSNGWVQNSIPNYCILMKKNQESGKIKKIRVTQSKEKMLGWSFITTEEERNEIWLSRSTKNEELYHKQNPFFFFVNSNLHRIGGQWFT